MAANWPNDSDSVLRGLFGSLLNAASRNLSTSDVWSTLRAGASNWAQSVLTVTEGPNVSQSTIDAKAQELLGHVSAADVSRYRGIAGQAVRAQQNLRQLGTGNQIGAREVFVAPWNVTADNPAIPTRYRLRILRSQSIIGLPQFEKITWSTYDLGVTLTSVDAALQLADDAFSRAKYNDAWQINEVLDYTIEAI